MSLLIYKKNKRNRCTNLFLKNDLKKVRNIMPLHSVFNLMNRNIKHWNFKLNFYLTFHGIQKLIRLLQIFIELIIFLMKNLYWFLGKTDIKLKLKKDYIIWKFKLKDLPLMLILLRLNTFKVNKNSFIFWKI